MFKRRTFLSLAAAVTAAGLAAIPITATPAAAAEEAPDAIAIDWAYYNPVAILLKNKGWLEEEFAADGTAIRWVLSLGSNKALEFLRGASLDFGSSAGGASLVARAGGLPIKAIYAYSRPEWTALVTRADSDIQTVADLKGRSRSADRRVGKECFRTCSSRWSPHP